MSTHQLLELLKEYNNKLGFINNNILPPLLYIMHNVNMNIKHAKQPKGISIYNLSNRDRYNPFNLYNI